MDYQEAYKEVMHKYYGERVCIREIKNIVVKFLEHNNGYITNEMKQYESKVQACKDKYELFQVDQEQVPIHCADFEQSYLVGCLAYIMSSLEHNLYSVLIKYKGEKVKKPRRNILNNLIDCMCKKLPRHLQKQFDEILIISKIRNSLVHNGGNYNNLTPEVVSFITEKPDKIAVGYDINGKKMIILTDSLVLYTIIYIENFFSELTDYLVSRTKYER